MNRIFKTVFSRSRGAMMVANELTKSHQVGKKAAVAVAVVGVLASASAMAENISYKGVTGTVTTSNTDRIIGGWNATSGTDFEEYIPGSSTSLVINSSSKFDDIIGGNHSKTTQPGSSYILGSTSVVIKNAVTEELVVGGSKYNGSNGKQITGSTYLEINGGTIGDRYADGQILTGMVFGGDILKLDDGKLDDDSDTRTLDIESTITNTTIKITGGTVNNLIFGGSGVQDWYENAGGYHDNVPGALLKAEVTGKASIVITGGTLNENLYLGGYAMAWNGQKSTSSVNEAELTISGSDVVMTGDIYAGGLEEPRTDGVSVEHSAITISGASVNNIYGYSGYHSYSGQDNLHTFTVNKNKSVATDLTLIDAKAKSVLLGEGSTLTVGGVNFIETLDFTNAVITGITDETTGTSAELTVESADLTGKIIFSGSLIYNGTLGNVDAMTVDGTVKIANKNGPVVLSSGNVTLKDGADLTLEGIDEGTYNGVVGGAGGVVTIDSESHNVGDVTISASAKEKGGGNAIAYMSGTINAKNVTLNATKYGIFSTSTDANISIHGEESVKINAGKGIQGECGDGVHISGSNNATTRITSKGDIAIDGRSAIQMTGGTVNVAGKNVVLSNTQANDTEGRAVILAGQVASYTPSVYVTAEETLSITAKETVPAIDIIDRARVTLKAKNVFINGDIVSYAKDAQTKMFNVPVESNGMLEISAAENIAINGGVSNYSGTFNLKNGSLALNDTTGYFGGNVSLIGGTLDVQGLKLADNTLAKTTLGAAATLVGLSSQFFANGYAAGVTEGGDFKSGLTLQGGTLALADKEYTLDYANSLVLPENGTGRIIMSGTLVGDVGGEDNTVTLDDIAAVDGEQKQLSQVTVKAQSSLADANKNTLQIGGTTPTDDKTIFRENSLSVGSIDMGSLNTLKIDGGQTLRLVGGEAESGSLIQKSEDNDEVTVNVTKGTLAIGGTDTKGGTITDNIIVDESGSITVDGEADFKLGKVTNNGVLDVQTGAALEVGELAGSGVVNVGKADPTDSSRGKLVVQNLTKQGGLVFVDPAWGAGSTIDDASHLEIYGFGASGELSTNLIAGTNSLITYGASAEKAASAFEKIAAVRGLSWAEGNVEAALYAGETINIGTGGILVDGSIGTDAAAAAATVVANTLTVAANGMLIVDQTVAGPAVNGKVVLEDGSYLGVVNASVGEYLIAGNAEDVTNNNPNNSFIVTDNPFINSELNGNVLSNTLDADGGLSALASTGIQAMTRRADSVLAQTIADRTSIDQEMGAGFNLWADVTGERYEADSLENGGSFKADTGYAAFGADFAVTQDITAGAAIQYGTGSLRSNVSNIKNDIDSYGITAYGSMKFGAAKLVGELAYIKSENDITSSQTALNQKVDANIYSAGIRAQYQLTAGNFQFVPSIGLRVSRLETDAMQIGAVNVEKQKQTLVQLPIALRINGFEQNVQGWSVAPSFKIAYVPTFGDKEIKVLGYEQDVIDTSPVQGDFGLRAQNGNLMLNANFLVGGGKDGTSSVGGKVGVKYLF